MGGGIRPSLLNSRGCSLTRPHPSQVTGRGIDQDGRVHPGVAAADQQGAQRLSLHRHSVEQLPVRLEALDAKALETLQ